MLESVHLKSEDLPNYKEFYVDNGALDQLRGNSNQLIIGRRGTGKTHLLGTFYELVRTEKRHKTDLPVLISIMEVRPQTPPIYFDRNSDEFHSRRVARELFSSFLRVFFNRFLDVVTERLAEIVKDGVPEVVNPIWDRTNRLLTDLLTEIESGTAYETERSRISELKTSTTKSKGGSLGAGIGLENRSLTGKANLAFNRDKAATGEESKKIEARAIFNTDLGRVRELVIAVLDCINAGVLYILIDEWMELDKRTPSKVQPHFAQLLKTTFFNTNAIAVKIATVWHETSLYTRGDMESAEGIQTGHDIGSDINLDTAFLRNSDDVRNFCKELLYRRVSHVCPKIRELKKDGRVNDIFLIELFDNEPNFRVFISASHGIPRDLMNVFQKCVRKIDQDFATRCIDASLIGEVSSTIYRTDKLKRVDPASAAQKLLSALNKYMEGKDRRVFFVRNEHTSSASLRKLVDEELVHQLPASVVHRDVRDQAKAYMVDFGNYADLVEVRRQPIEKLLDEFLVPTFPDDIGRNLDEYLIDPTKFDEGRETCPKCQNSFSINHPVFVKAGLCNTCGFQFPETKKSA